MLHLLLGRTDIPAGTFAWVRCWVWLLCWLSRWLFCLLCLLFSIWEIAMEKLHPFSLALILSNMYWLDSLKMFEGVFVLLPWRTMSKPQMCWGKNWLERKTSSGYRIYDQNVPEVPPRSRQIIKEGRVKSQFLICLMGSRSFPCENLCEGSGCCCTCCRGVCLCVGGFVGWEEGK